MSRKRNRKESTDTCEKNGHLTEKTGEGKTLTKMADMLLIGSVTRHLNLFPYWPP